MSRETETEWAWQVVVLNPWKLSRRPVACTSNVRTVFNGLQHYTVPAMKWYMLSSFVKWFQLAASLLETFWNYFIAVFHIYVMSFLWHHIFFPSRICGPSSWLFNEKAASRIHSSLLRMGSHLLHFMSWPFVCPDCYLFWDQAVPWGIW